MDQLYFVVHTHWDREWYQPFQRMRARLVTMTDKMLALLESGALPCFHFDGNPGYHAIESHGLSRRRTA